MIDVLEAWKSIQEFWGDFLKHKKVKKKKDRMDLNEPVCRRRVKLQRI